MKTSLAILVVLAWGISMLSGGEPPPYRSIAERVRFSTHVVAGEVRALRVVNEITGREIADPAADLRDGERIELEVVISEVLQADKSRGVKPGNVLKVRFGKRGHTPSVFKQMFSDKKLIFFLSQDAEHAARLDYFYPFFGETNLGELPDKLDMVKTAIVKLQERSE